MIDSKNVENLSHKDVVGIIKGIKTSSKFEVLGYNVDPVNPERDAEAASNGEIIFNIRKENNSYGFSLITNPASGDNEHEHCIKDVVENGPAGKAGVKNQMLLIAMNGHNCINLKHQAVVSLVKSGGKNCIMRCKVRNHKGLSQKNNKQDSNEPKILQKRSAMSIAYFIKNIVDCRSCGTGSRTGSGE